MATTYLAFLNPHKIHFLITQSYSLELPFVVFFLGSILIGAILTALLNWTVQIRHSLWQRRSKMIHKREEKEKQKLDELYEKGENAFYNNLFEKAKSLFNKVLCQDPQHPGALYYLGTLKRKEGKCDQAIDLHNKAAEQSPINPKVLLGLAEDYLESGKKEKGLKALQKLQKADPSSPTPLYKIRDLHFQKGEWNEAYAIQKDLIPLIKNSGERENEQNRLSEIIYFKGMVSYKNQQWEIAVNEFKNAIRQNKCSAPAYITLGDIYFKKNKQRKALKVWKRGFEKTHSLVCLQRIQQIHQKAEKPQEIIKLYRNAILSAHNSEKEALTLYLGAIFLDQGKPDEAINTLNTIQKDASLIQKILLAKSYQEAHNTDKAKKTSQSVFETAKASIFDYTCLFCHTSLKEWSGHCPVCKSWDKVTNRVAFNALSS